MGILIHGPEFAAWIVIEFQVIVGVDQAGINRPTFEIENRITSLWRLIEREYA